MSIKMNSQQLNDFASMMSDLMMVQQETNVYLTGKSVSETDRNEFTNKIKELLKKAQQLATEIQPKQFTISADIGLPPKISISFTW